MLPNICITFLFVKLNFLYVRGSQLANQMCSQYILLHAVQSNVVVIPLSYIVDCGHYHKNNLGSTREVLLHNHVMCKCYNKYPYTYMQSRVARPLNTVRAEISVNFTDFAVTYIYSENLVPRNSIHQNLLVYNN